MPNVIDVNKLCMGCMSMLENALSPCPFCGYDETAPLPETHRLRPKSILNGKYLVGRALGEGGFGITYLGWDLNLNVRVAIKEYFPAGLVTRRDSAASAAARPFTGPRHDIFVKGRDSFLEEARSLARFRSLPGIVSVNDFFTENGTAYIVMEYIEGQTLKEYLARSGGALPAGRVFALMRPVLTSLMRVHSDGMIHRDISPDNIMLDNEGSAKLLDFGAARDFSDGERSVSVLLKPGYTPVEQYQSRGVQGPYTDVYAVCATMYKMITGQTPPDALDRLEADTLEPPSRLGFSIDAEAERALMKGLAVSRQDRYQTVEELYAALYGVTSAPPEPELPAAPSPKPEPQRPALPAGARFDKAPQMIFTAANALSVIAGVILISLLAGLWPITLCFAFNLAYRLVTLIKKRAPSPAERRVRAAALAAVLLLIILLGSAKILAALSNGSLAPIMYVLSGGALVFAMLTLFAEAWYEALAARRAARTAGRRKMQPADIGLICALAAAPVLLFIFVRLYILPYTPQTAAAPPSSAAPSGTASPEPSPGLPKLSPTPSPDTGAPPSTDAPRTAEESLQALVSSGHEISILCAYGSAPAYAVERFFETSGAKVDLTEAPAPDLLNRLALRYTTGMLPDLFFWENTYMTAEELAAGMGVELSELAGTVLLLTYSPDGSGAAERTCMILLSPYSKVGAELLAVMNEMTEADTQMHHEVVSAIFDIENGAG